MTHSSVPGLHVAGDPAFFPQAVPERVPGGGRPWGGRVPVGPWPVVALTALELAFVLLLVRLAGCAPDEAVTIAAKVSAVAAAAFYMPQALVVVGRRVFDSPAGGGESGGR